MTVELYYCHGENTDIMLHQDQSLSLYSHPTFIHKDVFSPWSCNLLDLAVAALFVSPRGLAIP